MVPIIRYSNVNGMPVMELLERKYNDKAKAKEVMEAHCQAHPGAGGEVVACSRPVPLSILLLPQPLQWLNPSSSDQKRLLPICALLNGEFGVKGYYVGVPCILGSNGIEKNRRVQSRCRRTGHDR